MERWLVNPEGCCGRSENEWRIMIAEMRERGQGPIVTASLALLYLV